MERPAKLQKLDNLRRKVPHVSKSALSAILAEVAEEGVPELRQAHHMREATRQVLEQSSLYGPLLDRCCFVSKKGLQQPGALMVNVASLVAAAFGQGGSFTQLVKTTYARVPCSMERPWQFVLYTDEVSPGNVLANRQSRKIWVAYCSFVEFGVHLTQEPAWLVAGVFRSDFVQGLSAGIGQVVRVMLERIFCEKISPQTGLVVKDPEGEPLRLFFRMGMFLQDGAAQKFVFGIKGDAGSRFCMLCKNACAFNSSRDIHGEEDDEVFSGVCDLLRRSDLALCSDAEVFESVDRLKKRADEGCSKQDMARWQQATGFNLEPHGLLLAPKLRSVLRPVSQYCHDWMHATCANGTLTLVLFLVLQTMQQAKVPAWQMLLFRSDYVGQWTLPRATSMPHLSELFQKKKMEGSIAAKKFKCTASEALALYPIVRRWLRTGPMQRGQCMPACEAFLLMAEVVDMLHGAQRTQPISRVQLLHAVEQALVGCVQAGWEHNMIKKFHWLLHMPDTLERFGQLPACWTLERKHRMVSRYASTVRNTQKYEQSLLEETLAHDLAVLRAPGLFAQHCDLLEEHDCSKKLLEHLAAEGLACEGATGSGRARLASGQVACLRDVVLSTTGAAGQVHAFCRLGGQAFCLLELYELKEHQAQLESAHWTPLGQGLLQPLSEIRCCLTYARRNAIVTALLPRS
ncbi:unnamed protein product [Symbiodinium sp. CCMP2592]|nr:unnamed protein product [Symbiodinium sp. CCMP2592]